MKNLFILLSIISLLTALTPSSPVYAQTNPQNSSIIRIEIPINNNRYYEKGLTENLFKISGNGRGGGHAWLEYRTENNVYIIDPTWSDDYVYTGGNAKELYRESPAYGKHAFFITYPESRLIFGSSRNHNSFTARKTETALWDMGEITERNEQNSNGDM